MIEGRAYQLGILLVSAVLVSATLATFFPRVKTVSGVVSNSSGSAVPGAIVRVKATGTSTLTDADGRFTLEGFDPAIRVRVTSWQEGSCISGVDAWPWTRTVRLVLQPYLKSDRTDYDWQPPTTPTRSVATTWLKRRSLDVAAAVSVDGFYRPLADWFELGCRDCHSTIYGEWNQSAHAQGVNNIRFMTMYNGTSIDGSQSPPTRFVTRRDYGRVSIPPDPNRSYFGPGYKLDFPSNPGNCATCHLPTLKAKSSPYADSNHASGLDSQGTHCDFCHKISNVVLEPKTGAPYDNRPGMLSIELTRPGVGTDIFFGPYDDVDFGRDTYLPLIQESEICAPCHSASFWRVPIYESFTEWQASTYSAEGQTCQTCHMRPDGITTNFAPRRGGVERDPDDIATHAFPGASSKALLQEAAELAVNTTQANGQLVVDVSVTNSRAGHHLPTGSPLRQIFLVLTAIDEQGQMLPLVTGPMLPDWAGDLEGFPGVYFAKILQQIWTGEMPTASYWTPTRLVEDTRLPARVTRSARFTFISPRLGGTTISARLIYRRAYYRLMQQKNWDVADILMENEVVSLADSDFGREYLQ